MTALKTYLEEKKSMNIGNKTQYYTIGQVSEITGIKQNILRFCENEFDELYNETEVMGLTEEQAAKILADKWIKKTGFVKK